MSTQPDMRKYLQMFDRFFNNTGRMSSTYKPVFLRSLLDVGHYGDPARGKSLVGSKWLERRGDRLHVDLNFVAARFAKYYWDMQYSFRLRQSQDPMDANITRLIRAVHEKGKKPPTLKALAGDSMEQFRKSVVDRSIKREVIYHIRTDMRDLFEKVGPMTISIDYGMVEFFRTHRTVLRKGLTGVLAGYLEKLNKMTPQISNKIDGSNRTRPVLKKEVQAAIIEWQDSRCFYCEGALGEHNIDHVIPYNFVFSTDLYNCTAACRRCNCTKSDMLPERGFFDSVIERNVGVSGYMKEHNVRYDEESYKRLFEVCATEYSRGAFFSPF